MINLGKTYDELRIFPKIFVNRAPRPDNITAEAFLHSIPRLMSRIGILFSWFLEYGYLVNLLARLLFPCLKIKVVTC